MELVTNFERDENGQYTSIEQWLNGADIPEGSTFVAFDSVEFARSTGQLAISNVHCGTVEENSSLLTVDNRDNRWIVWSSINEGQINIHYYGIGSTMREALAERGVETPELSTDCIRVTQRIDVIRAIDYIGDGPMDLTSENRYDDGTLPAPNTDVEISPDGGFMAAVSTDLDPSDHLL